MQPVLIDLPYYPFNHSKSYWHESQESKHARERRSQMHELLGVSVPDWNPNQPRWRKFLDVAQTPWVEEHKVNGKAIYPAAGMVVMAIEAARGMAGPQRAVTGHRIRGATFSAPITASGTEKTQIQLYMRPDLHLSKQSLSSFDYCMYTLDKEKWVENCRGAIQIEYGMHEREVGARGDHAAKSYHQQRYEDAVRACNQKVGTKNMYDAFQENGMVYGTAFQAMDKLSWDGKACAVGELKCFEWTQKQSNIHRQPHVVHPVTLDAAGQLVWVALTKGGKEKLFNGLALTRIGKAWISSTGLSFPGSYHLRGYCETCRKGFRGTSLSTFALDEAGNLRISISEMETTAVDLVGATRASMNPRLLC